MKQLILSFIAIFMAVSICAAENEQPGEAETAQGDKITNKHSEQIHNHSEQTTVLAKELYRHGDTLRFNPDPTGALLRSAVFPGWGQLYNRKYIKSAVVAAGEILLIYYLLKNYNNYDEYRDKFNSSVPEDITAASPPFSSSLTSPDPGYYEARQVSFFNEWRHQNDKYDQFKWYTAFYIFLSMFDAYVDAHLIHFEAELSEDLETVSMKISYNF
ncbi:MAG: hypothetical protein GF307_10885 [candidate division Zixibacteria bacterium]|nr:hypothetical protein [candidate division Zixibacteria bacterium]